MAQSLPTIAGIQLTTDAAGRFNLNALHKASGEGSHKKPSEWLSLKSSKELVSAFIDQSGDSRSAYEDDPVSVVNGSENPGTFAHELIAISYAGWISPTFQLSVNRVFAAYRTGRLEPLAAPAANDGIDPVCRNLVFLKDRGLISAAAAEHAAFLALGLTPPAMPAPAAAPTAKPTAAPKPARASTPPPVRLALVSPDLLRNIQPENAFPFNEVATRVVGGEPALKRALISQGLMDQHGNATRKAAALTRKGPFAGVKNWLVLDTLRAVGALR